MGDNFTLGPLNASTVTTSNQSYTIFGDGQKVPSLQDIPFLVQLIQSLGTLFVRNTDILLMQY